MQKQKYHSSLNRFRFTDKSGINLQSIPRSTVRMCMPVVKIPNDATIQQVRDILDSTFEERMKQAFEHNLWI